MELSEMIVHDRQPLVSVIISTFNAAQYLSEALGSLRQQTYRAWEVIVIDDGSTDQTVEVATSFPEVKMIRLEKNLGPGNARNIGVQNSSGEILSFLDGDDIWTPEKLERQVGYLLEHPETGFVFAMQKFFFEPGAVVPSYIPGKLRNELHIAYGTGALAVWRSVFDHVGPFESRFSFVASDAEWFFRAQDMKVAHAVVPELCLLRRIHGTNVSHLKIQECHRLRMEMLKMSIDRKKQMANKLKSA